MLLKGITWDHRRAIDPLTETMTMFRARHPEIDIEWSSRPLSGFEFTPVSTLAETYDLIILDHPFMGAVAAAQTLVPIDDIVGSEDPFVGPSLDTYRMGGKTWALPVDAACQVGVSRRDLLTRLDSGPPGNWAELMALGAKALKRGQFLAMGFKGVHSLMTFFTLMANVGSPCASDGKQDFADRQTAREVLAMMRDLLRHCPPESLDWNSIALHDAMATRDDLVFCPAVYCYATYAEADQRHPLHFHDLPGPKGHGGSAIGGTGLAISARSKHIAEAMTYVRFAAEAATQMAFALHHGQPAHRQVWDDDAINERFGNCYRDTRATIDGSWIRPRYDGYLSFQEKGGEMMEAHLRGSIGEDELLAGLQDLYARR